MYDLIYGASARDGVLAAFPHAVVHDESDWIHDSRISVRLPDEDRECYLKGSGPQCTVKTLPVEMRKK